MKAFLFCIGMIACSVANSQGSFDYYLSSSGSDANPGNSMQLPKRSPAAVLSTVSNGAAPATPVKIGFKSGDVFNETFEPGFPVHAGTYFENGGRNKFAVLNGTAVFDSGWVPTPGSNHLFEQEITLSGFSGYGINNIGLYSIVSVFEIDRTLELVAPFTARRPLIFCNNQQVAEATPGSFYEPFTTNTNPVKIYVHPSDGGSPNHHTRYRYEVTVKDRAINSSFQENNYFSRLWIRGYGAGNGMLPSGANSEYDRMIFGPGSGIHHLGIRSGTVNNALILPAAKNAGNYALVFYDAEGLNRHNTVRNSIFLDVLSPLFAHTSTGTNYGALELDNVIAFADSSESVNFLDLINTDTLLMNNVYADGFKGDYLGHAAYATFKNCVFKNTINSLIFGSANVNTTINNCFIKTCGEAKVSGVSASDNANLVLANSIIYLKNDKRSADNIPIGTFINGFAGNNNFINAYGNIFIADTEPEKYVLAVGSYTPVNGADPHNFRFRNNVYVLLRGNKILWNINGGDGLGGRPEVLNFEQWRVRMGQDASSLYFDLRNDPRGLKAIFTDPDNGDYSLANTLEGNKIRELRAGMVSPIGCFLQKPSYETAAAIIMNDAVLSANACRKQCVQGDIRVAHQFDGTALAGKKVQLQWNLPDERGLDHYEVLRSYGNADFTSIGYIPATGQGSYSFTDSGTVPGITYRYSLAVVTGLLEKCYSQIQTVTVGNSKPLAVYPNPSRGRIMLAMNSYSGPVKVSIVNALGITVYSKELTAVYGAPLEINLTNQSKGFYYIKVQTDDESSAQSFVLQ